MDNNTASNNGGIGFILLLTIVFISLKLSNAINWSWFWVLSPIWISGLIVLVLSTLIILVAIIKNI